MDQDNKSLPRWGQWAAGLGLMAVALTAGGLSLAINVTAGLGIGIAAAVAYGLSDVAKLLLPVTCAAIGWNWHLRTAYAVVSVVSVLCAVVYLADIHAASVVSAEHRTDVRAATVATVADLESQLARLQAAADAEAATGIGPRWRELNDMAMKASERLQDSRKAAAVSPTDFSGSAVLTASLLAVAPIQATKGIALAKTVAALIVMELLVHLAGAAARLIGLAMAKPADADPLPVPDLAGKQPASQPRDARGRFARKWTRAEDYAKALEPA